MPTPCKLPGLNNTEVPSREMRRSQSAGFLHQEEGRSSGCARFILGLFSLLTVLVLSDLSWASIKSMQYLPLQLGNSWSYIENGSVLFTVTVSANVELGGTTTAQLVDDFDGTEQYFSNHPQGVQLHREIDPSTGDDLLYSPPIVFANAAAAIGESAKTVGTASGTIEGFAAAFDYQATSTPETFESITVPAGSFRALRIRTEIHFDGAIGGTPVVLDIVELTWVVRHIGPVRFESTVDGDTDVSELTATNISPPDATLLLGLGPNAISAGWLEELESAGDHAGESWQRVRWNAYNGGSEGESRPNGCDVDGDGKDEVVIGLGPYPENGGWLEIKDDQATGYATLAWIRVAFPAYNTSNGQTSPSCGDLDADGRDEIAVGLASGAGGWVQIFDDADSGFAVMPNTPFPNGWVRLGWSGYNQAHGRVNPAIGNLDNDAADELVLAVGAGGAGWVQVLDDALKGFNPLAGTPTSNGWIRLGWAQFNSVNGEIRPAVCDLNGDGLGEVVMGLGNSGGAWIQIFDSATGFSPFARTPQPNGWVRVSWSAIAQAGRGTHPTCNDIDHDGRDELVLGLDDYPVNGGWVEVKDDAASNLVHRSWARVHWSAYNSVSGEARPTIVQ